MPLGVHSEVGRLRRVMVHRPGLEHRRLTPHNAGELLFDDVIWVDRAEQEHDAFVQLMRHRGVEVFEVEDLFAEAMEQPACKQWVLSHILSERMVGPSAALRAAEQMEVLRTADWADFIIGGITKADIQRELDGLLYHALDPTSTLVPPLPNFPTSAIPPAGSTGASPSTPWPCRRASRRR